MRSGKQSPRGAQSRVPRCRAIAAVSPVSSGANSAYPAPRRVTCPASFGATPRDAQSNRRAPRESRRAVQSRDHRRIA
ncbi:hypothetical protein WL98_14115 [Burkholderia multivorans]|nr:hypothetical protein WL98_14115 [Burkholderia multivorans]